MEDRQPPGPINWPLASLWRQTNLLAFIRTLPGRYGDVSRFRVGRRNYYLLNHPDLVRQVLVTDAAKFIKGPAIRNAKITLGEGLLSSDGELHKRQRRLITPVFHPNRVATYVGQMVRNGEETAGRWRPGEVFDAHERMTALTLAVVTEVLFGGEIGEEVGRIGRAMGVLVNMFDRARNPMAPVLNVLPLPSNLRFLKALRDVESILNRFIENKRAALARGEKPSGRPDLLTLLLTAQDAEGGGGGMSDKQLRDEAITLFAAGHETTANALVFTWYLLARHPEIEREVHAEVDRVVGDREVQPEDVENLAYTRMVLAESMRLYPPAWVIAREALEDYEIAGYRAPAGSVLLMSQFLLHRDARFWPEPERFDPGRFTEEAKAARPRYAYFPFGSGPRSCIGEGFAWVEAVVLIATIARRWRLELAEQVRELPLHPTITLRPRGELMMRAIQRSRSL